MPNIVNVADLQKNYRSIATKLKTDGTPTVVVSNGKPDIILLSPEMYEKQSKRLAQLEENYLSQLVREGMEEYNQGKAVKLEPGKTLLDHL